MNLCSYGGHEARLIFKLCDIVPAVIQQV